MRIATKNHLMADNISNPYIQCVFGHESNGIMWIDNALSESANINIDESPKHHRLNTKMFTSMHTISPVMKM